MLIFVTDRKSAHLDLIANLKANGIYTFVCAYDAADALCKIKDTGGVVLDAIANLPRAEALCARLRAAYPEMPIAAIVAPLAVPDMAINTLIRICRNNDLAGEILDFCTHVCGWKTDRMTTYTLTVGNTPAETYYMGYPLPLSVREHEVLRCLFYRAPRITTKDDLMRLCYPEGHQKINNIVVQIHGINQKAAAIDPRPLIICHRGEGYALRDGIL
jgi:DNA-binding response OmpR family regulator